MKEFIAAHIATLTTTIDTATDAEQRALEAGMSLLGAFLNDVSRIADALEKGNDIANQYNGELVMSELTGDPRYAAEKTPDRTDWVKIAEHPVPAAFTVLVRYFDPEGEWVVGIAGPEPIPAIYTEWALIPE